MNLNLSDECLKECMKGLSLKAIAGINPDAANTALQELQAAIRESQLPIPPEGS